MTRRRRAPEDLLSPIRQGNRFLLTSHVNPDGDAIGSELGLARAAAQAGQGRRGLEPRPDAADLPPAARQRAHPHRRGAAGRLPRRRSTPCIVLECPSLDRTGLEAQLGRRCR